MAFLPKPYPLGSILVAILAFAISLTFAANSAQGIASQYGRLFADGNKIVAENSGGEPVQLKGPSMQWSVTGWGSDKFFIEETINALVDGWNAQIIRVPLGLSVSGGSGSNFDTGYDNPAHKGNVWNRVKTVADAAIAKDVYVIVDWHSHFAHLQTDLAIDFFTNPLFAGKYGNDPHVIFEIYNEPEDNVTWPTVKTYSNTVIKAIRDAGFDNLILVGNPHWDTETDIAANDPPTDSRNNFALTFHFYANAHKIDSKPYFAPAGTTYRSVVQTALDRGIPVFVSEWGTNDASDAGKPNFAETDKWHTYLNEKKISSCAWGVTASGIYGDNELDYWSRWGNPLHYDVSDLSNWIDLYRMTPHGRYIYHWLTGKDTTTAPGSSWPIYTGNKLPLTTSKWRIFGTNPGSTASVDYENEVAHITYSLNKGTYEWDPYIEAGFTVNGLSYCEYGISYQYRGSAHTLRAEQSNVKDYDYHRNYKSTPQSVSWVQVTIPWGFFWQDGWGEPAKRDSSLVRQLDWQVTAPGGSGEFWIKDVFCLGKCTTPIRMLQIASGRNILAHTANNSIILQNLPDNAKVEVFDLQGKRIHLNYSDNSQILRIMVQTKGIYIVKVSFGSEKKTLRVEVR
jgi:endoglucanase